MKQSNIVKEALYGRDASGRAGAKSLSNKLKEYHWPSADAARAQSTKLTVPISAPGHKRTKSKLLTNLRGLNVTRRGEGATINKLKSKPE